MTFHMVINAVGELEIMMIGFVDLAFFAPRDGSVPYVSASSSYATHECRTDHATAAETLVMLFHLWLQ